MLRYAGFMKHRPMLPTKPHHGRFRTIDSAPKTPNKPPTDSAHIPQSCSRTSGSKSSSAGFSAIRVLLVDDHKPMRRAMAEFLCHFSQRIELVGEAGDGRAALKMTGAVRPDVVIMDVSMPRMGGVEATMHIVNEYPNVKVIGLSNFSENEKGEAMIAAGAVRYLHKGIPPEDLVEAILGCFKKE